MQVRLLTWNIHKCVGGIDRRYDPDRTAAVIAASQADIVLMQEVGEHGSWYRGEKQLEELIDRLEYEHSTFFVNVNLGKRRGSYGNAILSRYPIVEAENIDLTQPGKKARSALHAKLRVPMPDNAVRTLHVFNLHLGLAERERRQQLVQFLAGKPFSHLRKRTPIVVAGDLNDVYGTLGPRLLGPAGFRKPPHLRKTFPAYAPLRALDGVYLRGSLDFVQVQAIKRRPAKAASDHLPLLAELELHN